MKAQSLWTLASFALGSLSILKLCLSFLRWLYVNFLTPAKDLKKYALGLSPLVPSMGSRKGLNLVLVDRNPDKLRDVSDFPWAKFSDKVQIIVVDFSDDLSGGIRRIEDVIEGLDAGF